MTDNKNNTGNSNTGYRNTISRHYMLNGMRPYRQGFERILAQPQLKD